MGFEADVDDDYDSYKGSTGSGGMMCRVEGTYLVQLETAEAKDDHEYLVFSIVGGPQAGKKIYERLYYRSNSGDPEKDRACVRRMLTYARAMGLRWKKGDRVNIEFGDYLNMCCVCTLKMTGTYTDRNGKEQERWGVGWAVNPLNKSSIEHLAKVEWDDESINVLDQTALPEYDEDGNELGDEERLTWGDVEAYLAGGEVVVGGGQVQQQAQQAQPQKQVAQPRQGTTAPAQQQQRAPAAQQPPAQQQRPPVKKGSPPAGGAGTGAAKRSSLPAGIDV